VKSIHLPIRLLYGLLALAPLALGGCSGTGDLAWGEQAGGGASQMAQAGAASGATIRTGSISTALINGTVAIIAQHQATGRQRQIAQKHGRAWTAHRLASSPSTPSKQPGHRYIAVDTASDSRTSPQARKSVMIFDTQAQQVVGKNVYDVQSPPPVGAIARFETYSAQYVGPGF
jgi:hypothetical protein